MCMWHSGLCYLVHFFSRLLIELKADQFFVNSLQLRAHIENPLGAKFLNSPQEITGFVWNSQIPSCVIGTHILVCRIVFLV